MRYESVRNPDIQKYALQLEKYPSSFLKRNRYREPLGESLSRPIPSVDKPSTLKLKPLPSNMCYDYLERSNTLSVIISNDMIKLRGREITQGTMRPQNSSWMDHNGHSGSSPTLCMCKIPMEDIINHQ
ncbi:Retrotrans gag domain-containing protein [Abeliophyllum distichum]|uniref:Retrotrans gag domain-containing protein n=1 Tax=Abeliophyllum distichum TaxID=126358 RepID=A0ABD1V5M5_9LAMI